MTQVLRELPVKPVSIREYALQVTAPRVKRWPFASNDSAIPPGRTGTPPELCSGLERSSTDSVAPTLIYRRGP